MLIFAFCSFSKAPTEMIGQFLQPFDASYRLTLTAEVTLKQSGNNSMARRKNKKKHFQKLIAAELMKIPAGKHRPNSKISSNVTFHSTPNNFMWPLIFTGCYKVLHRTSVSSMQVSEPNFITTARVTSSACLTKDLTIKMKVKKVIY
jgi:hypothetical protein